MNANGKVNGNAQTQQVQVNPVECARVALMFLARADFKAAERQMFDYAESLLRAIVDGHVVLSPAQASEPQPLAPPSPSAPADTVQ